MNRLLAFTAAMVLFVGAHAHHAAEGVAREDVWENVDAMLEDSPHATMDVDLNDMNGNVMILPAGGNSVDEVLEELTMLLGKGYTISLEMDGDYNTIITVERAG
jgi:hypothetical protein